MGPFQKTSPRRRCARRSACAVARADVEAHPALGHVVGRRPPAWPRPSANRRRPPRLPAGPARTASPRPSARARAATPRRPRPPPERSHLAAPRLDEGEAHRPADQQLVGQVEEPLDDLDLVGHLGPAEDHHERPLRLAQQRTQRVQLLLHQQAGHRREQRRHPGGGGVGPVGGAEGVVDVDVGQPRRAPRPTRGRSSSRAGRSASSPAAARRRAASPRPRLPAAGPVSRRPCAPACPGARPDARPPARAAGRRRARPWAGPGATSSITAAPALPQVRDGGQRGPDAGVVGHPAVRRAAR